ncbi:MAG: MerR family transcriptional regulator [Alphaproteobacteria bacterium]|nr:MerR family transcriptional regulator [Alphaproteobacteria bacterium]
MSSDVVWIESDPAEVAAPRSGYLTISEVASQHAVTPRALRFYESRGLLSPQREGRARYYSTRDVDRLMLILKAKKLGFTLTEIIEMVQAGEGATAGSLKLTRAKCVEQIEIMKRQRQDAEDALKELQRIHTLLSGADR